MSGPTSTPSCVGSPIESRSIDRQNPVAQLVGDRFVDDQSAQRRAALAAGAGGGEHDRAHGQLQVGRRRDDHAVVAAELQQRAAQPGGDRLRDGAAHRHAAGRRDQRQQRRRGKRLADLRAADDEVARSRPARRAMSAITSLHECLAGDRRERRFLRRLPDDRVAAHEAEHRVPRPHGDRKVERRDHADRARADASTR